MPPKKPAYADYISDEEWQLLHRKPVTPIPPVEKQYLIDRLTEYGRGLKWRDLCARVEVTFRGGYAYVEAWSVKPANPEIVRHFEESAYPAPWEDPFTLMRLGYLGTRDDWLYAFYKYSDEQHEPSFMPSGATSGTPEEAFDSAAGVYLVNA